MLRRYPNILDRITTHNLLQLWTTKPQCIEKNRRKNNSKRTTAKKKGKSKIKQKTTALGLADLEDKNTLSNAFMLLRAKHHTENLVGSFSSSLGILLYQEDRNHVTQALLAGNLMGKIGRNANLGNIKKHWTG